MERAAYGADESAKAAADAATSQTHAEDDMYHAGRMMGVAEDNADDAKAAKTEATEDAQNTQEEASIAETQATIAKNKMQKSDDKSKNAIKSDELGKRTEDDSEEYADDAKADMEEAIPAARRAKIR